jgi:hypothetical protein
LRSTPLLADRSSRASFSPSLPRDTFGDLKTDPLQIAETADRRGLDGITT